MGAHPSQNLVSSFDFLEQTYGPYLYGAKASAVIVNWGSGFIGGMEHHPNWHVADTYAAEPVVQAHEAAHGWYGNGVRIACWEDFVLSEGLATYLAARALDGEVDVWPTYACDLAAACRFGNTVALPDATCNAIDLDQHDLWGNTPYYKGAFYLREVAGIVGEAELDAALADFYMANREGAARMQALIDSIIAAHPTHKAAIDASTLKWLRTKECPADAPVCLVPVDPPLPI